MNRFHREKVHLQKPFAKKDYLRGKYSYVMKLELSHLSSFSSAEMLASKATDIHKAFSTIYNKNGLGNDFLGWVRLPSSISPKFIDEMVQCAATLHTKSDLFVVIGIGGSYLGARAVIEALSNPFTGTQPQIVYAGHNMSEDYLAALLEVLDKKDYSVCVISKSGTTTEPAIAFRIIKRHLENKYGVQEASSRIVTITDKAKGALKQMADNKGYRTFVIPDDIGGRYSVLTPVGLLPISVAGFDIRKLIAGAGEMERLCLSSQSVNDNPVAQYAAVRHALYEAGKTNEILVNYEPCLNYLSEWWKQLFGESHGKQHKGIFPASVTFTTDLHSMGQYIQEGLRNLFETVISIGQPHHELRIPDAADDLDQLNYIAGSRLSEVNHKAELGTILAHEDGDVPNIRILLPELSETTLGQLIYFFEMSCALSGYMLGVNPFDQPGVEAYKKNMFALLGKKGYEQQSEALKARMLE